MRPFTVTFYSYKGGVGRTLLAANIGVLRARRGKTLLWDLDIEAPGLHRILDLEPQAPIESGFFEWVQAWQKQGKAEPDYAALLARIQPSRVSGQLHILPAHGRDADPAGLYQSIDWHDFLHVNIDRGYRLFAQALRAFGQAGYQTVLLDARTGLTDLGGLIAALLPHVTVLVGNYGSQNAGGLAGIWRALQPLAERQLPVRGDLPPLERLLVASPVPPNFKDLAQAEKNWRDAFGLDPRESLSTVRFDQDVLFTDRLLAAHGEAGRPIVQDYQAIDAKLESFYQNNLVESRRLAGSEAARPEIYDPRRRGDAQQRGKTFEERVAHLLQLLGYSVERKQLQDNSNEIDLIASKRGDFGENVTYFVECKAYSGAVPKEAAEKLAVWIAGDQARQRRAKGMLVAEKEFTAATLGFCNNRSDLVALTYGQLERNLLDFTPYLARLRQRYESGALARWYVAQKARLSDQAERPEVDLVPHARRWARGAGSRLWLLLGDYGTGKSAFMEHLAYVLAGDCETDGEAPVPLAVNLKHFPNAITLEQLLQEHLRRELDLAVNPSILLHLLAAGRIVLLLDSFDEMGVATVGKSIEEQFRQLAAPTAQEGDSPQANRILITSRTHFFRDHAKAHGAANGLPDSALPDSPLGQAARSFQATLDDLQPFDGDQIKEYLGKRLGRSAGEQAWAGIEAIYGLPELARVPQLLDIILQALPTLKAGGKAATPGALYLIYTDQWLNDPRLRLSEMQLSARQVTLLLETLATALWSRADQRLHYADLAALVREHSPAVAAGMNHERVDLELRTAAFLVRSSDGYYRFSHKSFLEFFVARRLWQIAGRACPADELAAALDTARLNPETVSMLGDLLLANRAPGSAGDAGAAYRPLLAAAGALLAQPYRPRVSENALLLRYHLALHQVGGVRLASEVASAQMPGWPAAAQLQGAELDGLALFGIYLKSASLQKAGLAGSDLQAACLEGAQLQEADLRRAKLDSADFSHADLTGACLSDVSAHMAKLNHAQAAGSCWTAACLTQASLDGADFSSADLRAARLAAARGNPRLEGARLEGATAPDAESAAWPRLPTRPLHPDLLQGHGSPISSVAFSPDGRRILTGSADQTARLWDADSGSEIRRLQGHQGRITSVAFSPDDRRILTGSDDKTVRLWNADSGSEIRRLQGHQGGIRSVAFSPDGRRILTGSADQTARLWDADSGSEIRQLQGHQSGVTSIAFSPDGRRILTGSADQTALLWDADSGSEIRQFQGHQGGIASVAFSPDGRRILNACTDRTVRLWDADSGSEIRQFLGHQDWIRSVAFSPDGRRILTGSDDQTARLWDADSGSEIRQFRGRQGGINSVAFSPDGRRILTANNDQTARLWDTNSGSEIRQFLGYRSFIASVALSPDGRHILTSGFDGITRLWDADSGSEICQFLGRQDWITSVAFSSDGRRILTASLNKTARLWDADSGSEIRQFQGHQHWIISVAFSSDGRRILTGSHDQTARLWDADSGNEIRQLQGHQGGIASVAFSPNGRRLLTGSADNTARLWDADSGSEIRQLQGHQGGITSVAFSPDGKHILTGSADQTARLWDANSGSEIRQFRGHQGEIINATFSPDGHHILTASTDATARLWDAATGRCLAWCWANGNAWFWLDARPFSPGAVLDRLPGPVLKGRGPTPLVFVDPGEVPQPAPWIPRHWRADDLPELWQAESPR